MENKDKRILKREPKLKVQLNAEQKEVGRLFHEYDVSFVLGDFGSGKTLTAVHMAVTSFRKKMFNKIWITRPMLRNNDLAALPGDINDKMAPYVYPIKQNLEVCQGKEITDKMIDKGQIEILPVSVAKGVTFMDSVVVVDEFQDMTYQDFRTILTRLKQQIDKSVGRHSCIWDVLKLEDSGLVGFTTLEANHRNPILTDIINYLEDE
jgi:phosphate starvation-inducible PhoH-like protein